MLGETFEYVRTDKKFKFIAEQVILKFFLFKISLGLKKKSFRFLIILQFPPVMRKVAAVGLGGKMLGWKLNFGENQWKFNPLELFNWSCRNLAKNIHGINLPPVYIIYSLGSVGLINTEKWPSLAVLELNAGWFLKKLANS